MNIDQLENKYIIAVLLEVYFTLAPLPQNIDGQNDDHGRKSDRPGQKDEEIAIVWTRIKSKQKIHDQARRDIDGDAADIIRNLPEH